MGINVKEKDGKIVYNDTQFYDTNGILRKYRNESMAKRMLESQIEKGPNQIKELEGEKEIFHAHISAVEKQIKSFEQIFQKMQIEPKEELKALREKYSDMELQKKSEEISAQQSFELKDTGNGKIERIIKNNYSMEELVILYASNHFQLMNAQGRIANINDTIEKIKTRLNVQKDELEKVKDSMHSIEFYFKSKHMDINRLLDQEAQNRNKDEKVAEKIEFPSSN